MNHKLGTWYTNTNDGSIVKLVKVKYINDDHLATLYLMKYIKKGKYPSLSKSNYVYYIDDTFERCRKLSKEEKMAILL